MKMTRSNRDHAAFTLVEIALALAIIGFALVAIIGVLPFGLNVQKENREETIVVQDANFFLDAIRNGSRGLDDLTNYVDSITNFQTVYAIIDGDTNRITNPAPDVYAYTYQQAWLNGNTRPQHVITNGERIVGLLGTPRLIPVFNDGNQTPFPNLLVSNYVVAYIRALSGPAIEKAPQTNTIVRDLAFRYRLIPEITPFDNWNLNWVNFNVNGLTTNEVLVRSNAWRIARQAQVNTHELRLLFRWPVDARGQAGNQRQVFRTLMSGNLQATNHRQLDIWLMQPSTYYAAVTNQ